MNLETEGPPNNPPANFAVERRWRRLVFPVFICVALGLLTFAIYFQTRSYRYLTYDDNDYVYTNQWVQRGFTADGVVWAFKALYFNWHPLTWLSLMLDVELFGLNAGPPHLVNMMLHMASAILLFFTLVRFTGKSARSAVVATVFAVHPLHVESVAWIAERKDVLSTFFEILTLLLYGRYVRNPTWRRYWTVAITFACSLMAKPMAVTLPFVMLLLDYWPLGRAEWPPRRANLRPLIQEKVPLIVLSVVSGILTAIAQKNGGAVMSLVRAPLSGRVANAFAACLWYLEKSIWPTKLAVFYPLEPVPMARAAGAAALVGLITVIAVLWRRRRPYVIVGWLWFLVMLLPVSGLVQVGLQAMADRYSYVPMVGLSIAVVWLLADALAGGLIRQAAGGTVALATILVLTAIAWRQTGYWRDSQTLYEHALAVTRRNYLIENNLGVLLSMQGRHYEAMTHLEKSVALRGDYPARANLGAELLDHGRVDEAFVQLTEALRQMPKQPLTEANLGAIYRRRGNYPEARRLLELAIQDMPTNSFPHADLCLVLARTGHLDEAIGHCLEAVRLKPDNGEARFDLAETLAAMGNREAAIDEYKSLLRMYPTYPGARDALEKLPSK